MSTALQRRAYTVFAPWYDLAVESVTAEARGTSLGRLKPGRDHDLLLCGAGSGLDIPHLPPGPTVTALDLTPAMLRRARKRASSCRRAVSFVIGDVTALPFAATSFNAVVLHLILAVVPRPDLALAEAARVLRPGGRLLIFDKFLKPGERAPVRRLANIALSPFLTRTNVVFEEVLTAVPGLCVTEDRPALLGGWFRFITLERQSSR
jgi:phosphatidylethanolamine/phosphatidyl-N-methylethanolamine N-methyltransferase